MSGRASRPRLLIITLAVLLTAGYYMLPSGRGVAPSQPAQAATEHMLSAMRTISAARSRLLPDESFEYDMNGTGLIGLSWSEITTSGGNREAKRTATDPLWAGVLAGWFTEAGLQAGDVVAASFSGSFPGLNLAVISAARALDLQLIAIASVGASNYGANHPLFTWPDMELALLGDGWPARFLSRATAMGGSGDMATGLEQGGRSMIRAAMERRGVRQLLGTGLGDMAARRLDYFRTEAGRTERDISLYVNVGGASASTGFCPDWVELGHGFIDSLPDCPGGRRGVMHEMLDAGVPVLHLLNVRALAAEAGIPIDRRFRLQPD